MRELWQLYDENGKPLIGSGAAPNVIFTQGLLHGASHVWIWRHKNGQKEVLVQRRAAAKMTYPNMLDISAAGHINLGESPKQAAAREVHEEIGLHIRSPDLALIVKHRNKQLASPMHTENEWKWVYLYELRVATEFDLQTTEVAALLWKPFSQFAKELSAEPDAGNYVYQGDGYFEALLTALEVK